MRFHQLKLGKIIARYCPLLVKCAKPTAAGAVLEMTFHVPVLVKDFKSEMLLSTCAATKRWIHLDGDIDTEVDDADGNRGVDFDDMRTVVTTRLGVTSRKKYEELLKSGFFSSKPSSIDLTSDESIDLTSDSEDEPVTKPPKKAKFNTEVIVVD